MLDEHAPLNRTSTRDEPSREATRVRVPNPDFMADVIAGLGAHPKQLSPKYFYDNVGSALFEEITRLPEYYPTRAEIRILREQGGEILREIDPGSALIEFGSGSSAKIRVLLAHRPNLAVYVPVDVSGDMLRAEAAQLATDHPDLDIVPVAADFTKPFVLPAEIRDLPRAGFFPGSTIGNFDKPAAIAFLAHARRILGAGGRMIVGVDLVKDAAILDAAYDDAAGVTARFNLNVLARINRELGGDIDLARFSHRAFFNPDLSRVEMHLVSATRQRVRIGSASFDFAPGETIHTESSYKYTLDSFRALAREAGWRPSAVWTDPDGLFSVHALA